MLYRLRGDVNDLETHLDGHPDIISCELVDIQGATVHFYVHVGPGQPTGKLMAATEKYTLMLVPPVEFTNGGLRMTIVGTHETIRKCLLELPDDFHVSVDRVGQYLPDAPR